MPEALVRCGRGRRSRPEPSSTPRLARWPSSRARTARSPSPRLDEHQVVAYDLAHAAAAVEGSRVMCRYGEHGEVESMLARAYIADAVHDVATRVLGRSQAWNVEPDALAAAMPFVAEHRAPAFLESLADQCVKHGIGPDAPLRRLRARRRDVPPLRRRQDPAGRRARAPHQRRRARRHHQRARRARRLRALGARGVRRLRDRRRVRLHGHGRRDRRAVTRLARHRRFARHPARRSSPARSSPAAPKNRSRRGCRASRAAS